MIENIKGALKYITSLYGQSKNLAKNYPSISCSLDQFASRHAKGSAEYSKSLDLGCGARPRNPFSAAELFGVDIRTDLIEQVRQADLSVEAIPYKSDFFDFCTAFNFLEHIPRSTLADGKGRLAFLELMNEIYRVLKPDGLFLHLTPAYPSKEAFQDPTHVNIITEDTMPIYFCEPHAWAAKLGYGFSGSFALVEQRWVNDIWIAGVMRALK